MQGATLSGLPLALRSLRTRRGMEEEKWSGKAFGIASLGMSGCGRFGWHSNDNPED